MRLVRWVRCEGGRVGRAASLVCSVQSYLESVQEEFKNIYEMLKVMSHQMPERASSPSQRKFGERGEVCRKPQR